MSMFPSSLPGGKSASDDFFQFGCTVILAVVAALVVIAVALIIARFFIPVAA